MSSFDGIRLAVSMQTNNSPIDLKKIETPHSPDLPHSPKGNSIDLKSVPDVRMDKVDFKSHPRRFSNYEFDAERAVKTCFGPKYLGGDIPTVMYDPQHEFTYDDLSELAGNAAKTIDRGYESGFYTDDEYAQLNTELEKYTKYLADKICEWKADRKWEAEQVALHAKYGPSYWKLQSREERELDRLSTIQEYRKQNPPDYDSIFSMMNQWRFDPPGRVVSGKIKAQLSGKVGYDSWKNY